MPEESIAKYLCLISLLLCRSPLFPTVPKINQQPVTLRIVGIMIILEDLLLVVVCFQYLPFSLRQCKRSFRGASDDGQKSTKRWWWHFSSQSFVWVDARQFKSMNKIWECLSPKPKTNNLGLEAITVHHINLDGNLVKPWLHSAPSTSRHETQSSWRRGCQNDSMNESLNSLSLSSTLEAHAVFPFCEIEFKGFEGFRFGETQFQKIIQVKRWLRSMPSPSSSRWCHSSYDEVAYCGSQQSVLCFPMHIGTYGPNWTLLYFPWHLETRRIGLLFGQCQLWKRKEAAFSDVQGKRHFVQTAQH